MATGTAQPGEHWWDEIRPQISIVVLCFVLFLALSLQNRVIDADYWWHLRTGQWILEEGRIPYTDPFSFTMQGQPWIAHSWLADIAMYLLYHYIGPLSLLLLRSLLQMGTWALLFKILWERWPRLWGPLLLLLVASFAGAKFWLARPNTASLVLIVVVFYLWYLFKWHDLDRLWLLPPLFVLWANVHSGWIYGLALLGALFVGEFLAGRYWPDPAALERKRHLRLGLFALLCVPAVALNPYGPRLFLYPFSYYLGGITLHTGYVSEWLSPNFHEPSNLLLALLLLALIAVLAWRRGTLGPAETLALLLFVGLALSSVRAAGIAIPLLVCAIAGVMGQSVGPRPVSARRGAWRPPSRSTTWAWYGGTLLLVLLLLTAVSVEYAAWGRANGFDGEHAAPREAVTALAGLDAQRPFNSYNWGGYLIWRLYPQQLVFIDGRADLYGDTLFRQYLQVARAEPDWNEVLSTYQVDAVICEHQGPLATLLTADSGWQPVYEDTMAAVFRRVP
jgi:hypothetical protein